MSSFVKFVFLMLLSTTFAYGEGVCDVVQTLLKENDQYQCPQVDKRLADHLRGLLFVPNLTNVICNTNPSPSQCDSGPFSLINEMIGLMQIVYANDPSYCPMAPADQEQVHLDLINFENKACNNSVN